MNTRVWRKCRCKDRKRNTKDFGIPSRAEEQEDAEMQLCTYYHHYCGV